KVIVVGGGHNGLIAAFYLAKGGFKPLVLERREVVGGGAVTEEFHPGFCVSSLAHTLGPLRADIAADLQVEKFDCEILRPDPRVFAPTPDGRAILFYDDVQKTAGGIARFSAKDGEQYPKFAKALEEVAGVFAQLSSITPPAIDKPTPEDLWNLLKTGRGVRKLGKRRIFDLLRWGPMAAADFAAEFFETELIRAVIAARGIFGTALGPWSAGSTAVLLLRAAADANPAGPAAFVGGGLGKFTNALAEAFRAALSGRIHIGPEIDYLEKAFDASKYGGYAASPYLEMTIPTILDPALAPEGKHVASVYVQFAPYKLKNGNWETQRRELGQTVIRTLGQYAPDLPSLVEGMQVITPKDLETEYGFTGGHIFHGELALDQIF